MITIQRSILSILMTCWIVVVFSSSTSAAADNPRLNVLLIAFDDLRPELGCYGNKLIDTPNFDALAKTGVRFERAYCQFPLCNPSRTSLLTGRQPNTTGVYDNRTYFRDAHPDFVTLPQHFKANGYVTARTGKIFHGGIDDTDAWMMGGEPRVDQKTRPGQDPMMSDRIVKLEGDGESHGDYKSATRAIQLLEELKDKPFFLAVGFAKPHSPPTAPAKLFDLYDVANIPLPPDFAPRPTVPPGFPESSVPLRSGDLFIGRDASPEAAREVIRAYYASTTFVDRQLGRVMEAVDRLKLRDKTVIILFGDHGYHLGEKGKWSKHNSVFEIACRVPLDRLLARRRGRQIIAANGAASRHLSNVLRGGRRCPAAQPGRPQPRIAGSRSASRMVASRLHRLPQWAGHWPIRTQRAVAV